MEFSVLVLNNEGFTHVLPPAPITTCPLSLPDSPAQVNGFHNELKMFLRKAMQKKTKTDSGNILLDMLCFLPHFLAHDGGPALLF